MPHWIMIVLLFFIFPYRFVHYFSVEARFSAVAQNNIRANEKSNEHMQEKVNMFL